MFRFGFFLFVALLVRNSPTSNNEVDWFSLVLGVSLSFYIVVWFGCSPQWRKKVYRENCGFEGRCCPFFFLNSCFCFGHNLAINYPN